MVVSRWVVMAHRCHLVCAHHLVLPSPHYLVPSQAVGQLPGQQLSWFSVGHRSEGIQHEYAQAVHTRSRQAGFWFSGPEVWCHSPPPLIWSSSLHLGQLIGCPSWYTVSS